MKNFNWIDCDRIYYLILFLTVVILSVSIQSCETDYPELDTENIRQNSIEADSILICDFPLLSPNVILGMYPYNMTPNALYGGSYPADLSMTAICPLYLQTLDTTTMQYGLLDASESLYEIEWIWNDGLDSLVNHNPFDTLTVVYGGSKIQNIETEGPGEFGYLRLSGSLTGCDSTQYDEYAPFRTQTRKIEVHVLDARYEYRYGSAIGLVRREDANCVIEGSTFRYDNSLTSSYNNEIETWLQSHGRSSECGLKLPNAIRNILTKENRINIKSIEEINIINSKK